MPQIVLQTTFRVFTVFSFVVRRLPGSFPFNLVANLFALFKPMRAWV
jgi:hypothetical protein